MDCRKRRRLVFSSGEFECIGGLGFGMGVGDELFGLFEEIHKKGNTIILVTHEEDIALHAHRIVRLKDGLVESDTLNSRITTYKNRMEELGKVHGQP